jgi:hypothetical protein
LMAVTESTDVKPKISLLKLPSANH